MEFEWDEQKAQLNIQKHHIDFRDAVHVFFDTNRLDDEDYTTAEERYRTIGLARGRILFVVYTWREGRIRLISARKATKYERQQYETH
ncbi:MAG: BrnT family toxin [Anaerolineae bacterium]|nr:BrnT family toxin [Anaerolineae bacterium]